MNLVVNVEMKSGEFMLDIMKRIMKLIDVLRNIIYPSLLYGELLWSLHYHVATYVTKLTNRRV